MSRFFFLGISFICLLLLTGCDYHFEDQSIASRYSTISVPYAEGDVDGSFTTTLIKQVAASTVFQYKRTGADLILKIRLVDFTDDNIGFRYYRNKENKLTRETIPVETRLTATAELSLIDAASGKLVLTPVRIMASSDFDHDYYSTKDEINIFSLGQLTDYDEALDAAQKPLHYNLARKIVDYLADAW